MTEQQLHALKEQLLAEKEELIASNALREQQPMEDVEGVDNHPAEQGTELADELSLIHI